MSTITEALTRGNSRYKAAEPLTPVGVILHSIGTPQPSARVLQEYWDRNGSPYVTHYVLDDREILRCMPDNFKCWHVGSPGNAKWLGIEMCEPRQIEYTSGATFTVSDRTAARAFATACYENAVWLLAYLCKKYGWNPQTAILTHGEVTRTKVSNTDHVDPEHLWKGLGLSYSLKTLRDDVAARMGEQPKQEDSGVIYRIQVGAFSKKANAAIKMEAVKAAGFDAFLTVGKDNLWRVQVGAFRNRDYAEAYLAKVKAAGFSSFVTTATGTASPAPALKSVDEIAQEVIRGKWGSGADRKNRLEAAGYDYAAVQNRVNQLMK